VTSVRHPAAPVSEARGCIPEPPSGESPRGVGSRPCALSPADTAALTPAQLAEYAGDYRSGEVEATHTWRVEKGQLVLYPNDRRLGVLEPGYEDGFARGAP
jgi:hypothetical protein